MGLCVYRFVFLIFFVFYMFLGFLGPFVLFIRCCCFLGGIAVVLVWVFGFVCVCFCVYVCLSCLEFVVYFCFLSMCTDCFFSCVMWLKCFYVVLVG